MVSQPWLLLFALLLLWFPRRWMRLGRTLWRRKRNRRTREPWERREPGDPRLSFWEEVGKMRNWVDLFRGAAGSLALLGGHGLEPSLVAAEGASRAGLGMIAAQFAILFIGLLIQVVRKESGRGSFFAPVFYLAGVAVGLCGGWAVVFAFILVWAVNPMLANAGAFLMVEGLGLAAFGLMLRGTGDVRPIIAALLCLAPALLSLLLRRPLVVFSRKAPADGGTTS